MRKRTKHQRWRKRSLHQPRRNRRGGIAGFILRKVYVAGDPLREWVMGSSRLVRLTLLRLRMPQCFPCTVPVAALRLSGCDSAPSWPPGTVYSPDGATEGRQGTISRIRCTTVICTVRPFDPAKCATPGTRPSNTCSHRTRISSAARLSGVASRSVYLTYPYTCGEVIVRRSAYTGLAGTMVRPSRERLRTEEHVRRAFSPTFIAHSRNCPGDSSIFFCTAYLGRRRSRLRPGDVLARLGARGRLGDTVGLARPEKSGTNAFAGERGCSHEPSIDPILAGSVLGQLEETCSLSPPVVRFSLQLQPAFMHSLQLFHVPCSYVLALGA